MVPPPNDKKPKRGKDKSKRVAAGGAIATKTRKELKAAYKSCKKYIATAETNETGCKLVTKKANKPKNGYPLESKTLIPIHVIVHFRKKTNRFKEKPVVIDKYHVSHLCGNSTCARADHLHYEPGETNQRRKGCNAGFACKCGAKMHTCKHEPKCLTWGVGTCGACAGTSRDTAIEL